MYWRLAHEGLKWLPTAAGGSALALSSAFEGPKAWVGERAGLAWQAMNSPLVATVVLIGVMIYAGALVVTGVLARRQEKPKPDLRGKVHNVIWGGELPDKKRILFCEVEIANLGEMSSAIPIRSWTLRLCSDGRVSDIGFAAFPNGLAMSANDGLRFTATPEESIQSRALSPIDTGAICYGYLAGALSLEQFGALEGGATVEVHFNDVTGAPCSFKFKPGQGSAYVPYTPFGKLEVTNG